MQHLPNAKLVVHPRGTSHMANPVKLIAGVMAVYGESEFRRVYGEILPISVGRIIEAPDDTLIELNGRPLRLLDTPDMRGTTIAFMMPAARPSSLATPLVCRIVNSMPTDWNSFSNHFTSAV